MNLPTIISSICNRRRKYLNLKCYLCTLEKHSPHVSLTTGMCILLGSALVHHTVCPHVLEKCGNFGKRWIFPNKISSVLFAGWPSGSGRSAGFAANWTTTPGRIRLPSHRNGIFQNEGGTAVFFLLCFLSINVTLYNVLFILVWDFWTLWPSHFKLSGTGIADTGTDLFCLPAFHVLILICTLHPGGGWF